MRSDQDVSRAQLSPASSALGTTSNNSSSPKSTGESQKDVDSDVWSDESDDEKSESSETSKSKEHLPLLRTQVDPPPPVAHHGGNRTTSSQEDLERAKPPKEKEKITWRSLPRKDQLALLTLARLSEPLMQTSLQSYMFYQLKSFDPSLSDSAISMQVGLLAGAFTGAQFVTAMAWGKAADSELFGRKKVILIGLMGTAISSIGFGFARSFPAAVIFRTMGGLLNGNVGVMRTSIAEIIKEKKYQSRAFMIMPMAFNIGIIIGPIMGGLLADPVNTYPSIFGAGSVFGGKDGVAWMKHWPYAFPSLINGIYLAVSSFALWLGFEETHEALRDKTDFGIELGRRLFCRKRRSQEYSAIPHDEVTTAEGSTSIELQPTSATEPPTSVHLPPKPKVHRKLPFRRIWTRNVIFTLISHGFLATHLGTFNSVWFVFLSAPRFDPNHPSPPSHTSQHLPFNFNGGLALPPSQIGMALSVIGIAGILLQLLIYPRLTTKYGVTKCFRLSLLVFPIVYLVTPYLAVTPSSSTPPNPVAGAPIWAGIIAVLGIYAVGRVFSLPGTTILVNNCCPHPSVLGTIHGIGQSVSSGLRTVGPILGGWVLGKGMRVGVVGIVFWILAIWASFGALAACFVKNGTGHEIILDGEEEEEEKGDK